MKTLRVPGRSVVPEDFKGGQAICQNLDCLAPIEPPVNVFTLRSRDGRVLRTVLCRLCLPAAKVGDEIVFQVVPDPPVLELPG
jgi:hypothetical protein